MATTESHGRLEVIVPSLPAAALRGFIVGGGDHDTVGRAVARMFAVSYSALAGRRVSGFWGFFYGKVFSVDGLFFLSCGNSELRHSPEFLPPPEEIELRRLWHQGGELVSSEQKRLMVAQAQNTSPLVLNSGFYQPGTRRFTPDVTARLLRVNSPPYVRLRPSFARFSSTRSSSVRFSSVRFYFADLHLLLARPTKKVTDPSIVPVLPGPTPEQLLRADSEREKTRADAAEARADAAEARADASDIVVEQLQQRVSELYQEFIRSNETAAQTVAQTVAHKDRTIASTTAEWQGKLSGAQQGELRYSFDCCSPPCFKTPLLAYQKALQDVKDLNAVDASEHITRIRELEQAANASAAAHAADIDRINSDHTEERQTMVKKMNENMGDIVTEMTLAKSEAVKAGRQALVDQNQVLSKEVLRLRASEFRRNVDICVFWSLTSY